MNKSSKSVDPYACAIEIKPFFDTCLTVEHIPREISHHLLFLYGRSGNITDHLISTTNKEYPIPAGGSEVPLLKTFSVKRERIFKLINSFANDLYD